MRTVRTAAVLAMVSALALAGCSRGSGGASAASGAKGSRAKNATMIMSTLNNPFFVSVKNGAQAEARKLDFQLTVQNANNSDATSLNLATTAVSKQVGALIIDPVSTQSATSAVTQANTAKIPVLGFDRMPGGGKLASFIGYDAIEAGKRAADALAKSLHGKGEVVEIQGILGTNVAQDRSKGFEREIATYPGIKVIAKQSANFDRATALDAMTNILQAHPAVNGVYAANDEMAMGVLAALKSRNLAGHVQLVGNDGISDALQAIAAGQMYATNAESPYALGRQVAELTADVLGGKTVRANQVLEGELVTKANVKSYAQTLVGLGDSADVPPSLK
jgi:ribose transport system substrate-binding protein